MDGSNTRGFTCVCNIPCNRTARSDERFEKAMRQTLRFLLFDGDWELCFPATLVETNDERVEAPNVSNALIRVFCDASHATYEINTT